MHLFVESPETQSELSFHHYFHIFEAFKLWSVPVTLIIFSKQVKIMYLALKLV